VLSEPALNGYYPGLPQVARAYLITQQPLPLVVVAPTERVGLYDLGAWGVATHFNPGLEAVGLPPVAVFSYEQALEAFPQHPDEWRLVLRVGQRYLRAELLEQLFRMGYLREEDIRVQGEVVEVGPLRLEFFGDQLETLRLEGTPIEGYTLLARAGKAETWDSVKLAHFPGTLLLDTPSLAPAEFWRWAQGRPLITFGRGGPELEAIPLPLQPLTPYRARLTVFQEEVKNYLSQGYSAVFFYKHARSYDYLTRKLELSWQQAPTATYRPGYLTLVPGHYEGAFADHGQKRLYLTENHLYAFGANQALQVRRAGGSEVADPGVLQYGDYLIHPEHGIGQFLGLEPREILGVRRDYLILQYAGEGRLYLPVEQLPLLKRHPGTTDDPPRLSSLGKQEWKKAREKAQKDAEELAQRLIVLHARRESAPGTAFPPLPDWDPLIEKNFPHTLTPDQERSLQDVFRDLELPRPMERLISGDVGFGKTEVALRAAHRVVGHGKQVAVLVPTTLLAEQHAATFRQRLAGVPVNVEGLSRFTSDRDESRILKGLASGGVDIVVGTHRLLSRDVVYKNLGLLVVDEEHRFGVAQKERIREIADAVDTLFLSATPIPRTLYSALVGLRDLSSIQTPPPGRRPIQTILAPYDPSLVRSAILDEMERGGKVFYVHDRVATIQARQRYLETLAPEARVGVVHGQMPEADIEQSMAAFADGAFDVLLATTIVESGLDIPEANTILIERADKLGLAALYQLRGRVGRRDKDAYAFMFHPPRLTEASERRLSAIADLSDLGSGHLLAEKDMEIRGVGNLLGPEQHGHIRAVSLEIYTELLAEAVKKLKGEVAEPVRHVTIDLSLSARLTPEFIPSPEARSRYYGLLAQATSLPQLSRIARDLGERYGQLPLEVAHFLSLSRLRLLAQSRGVVSITEDLTSLQMTFATAAIDYDVRGFRALPFKAELTQYPPGFRLYKKGLSPTQYLEALTDLLYLLA
jgi:transcription-repair coupling factor (superfamily II helicase)